MGSMEWDDLAARRLSTRELRIFLAVAHTRSMAKAAKTVGTSQPAISKTIADMEHALGVQLLDRSPQGVEPTQYGRAVVKCGIAVFCEVKRGIKEIGYLADPTAGELSIGCIGEVSVGLVQAVINRLLQKHPRLRFHIETESLYRELQERNIEFVIDRMPGPFAEEDFDVEILYDDPVVVVAGANNPWTRRRKVQLADLVNELWVMPKSDSSLWLSLIKAFGANGLTPPRATVTTSSGHVRSSFLATGRFLSVRPRSVLWFQGDQPSLKALPVKLPTAHRPIAIVTLKNRSLSPVARLFIACLHEVAKPLMNGK
jgi:DNA-binding transcriptional LysR family regulator